jgi:hypothetical protein
VGGLGRGAKNDAGFLDDFHPVTSVKKLLTRLAMVLFRLDLATYIDIGPKMIKSYCRDIECSHR